MKRKKIQKTLTGEELEQVERKTRAAQGKFSYYLKYEIKSPFSLQFYNVNYEYIDNYPAKISEDFVRDMVLIYSDEGDCVWDGCCGSGTVPRVANALGRIAYGTDQNKDSVEIAIQHDKKNMEKYWVHDAKNPITLPFQPKLILSSLPFGLNIAGDKNTYSINETDISNSKDYEEFFEKAELIIKTYHDTLKDSGIMILDARDRFDNGRTVFLMFEFWKIAKKLGFIEISRGEYPLWPYKQQTIKDRETGKVKLMVSQMDFTIMKKPNKSSLEIF